MGYIRLVTAQSLAGSLAQTIRRSNHGYVFSFASMQQNNRVPEMAESPANTRCVGRSLSVTQLEGIDLPAAG